MSGDLKYPVMLYYVNPPDNFFLIHLFYKEKWQFSNKSADKIYINILFEKKNGLRSLTDQK